MSLHSKLAFSCGGYGLKSRHLRHWGPEGRLDRYEGILFRRHFVCDGGHLVRGH